MIHLRLTWLALLFAALTACSSVPRIVNEYKIDIQQGNVLTQEMVSQLRPGLTKDQVRFILGTPILTDMFHASRWDYVYRFQKGGASEAEMRKFSVFFDEKDRLFRVIGDVSAAEATDTKVNEEGRLREIDLGSVPADTVAPPIEEQGFWGQMKESVGF